MLEELKVLLRALVDDDEFLEMVAQVHMKFYNKLREVGFSHDKATLITAQLKLG